MTEIFSVVGRLAPTDVTVTLTGETGTGKDVFAHLLHELSPRARQPFVVFDCGAVPANLMESELFGHERGAFTGAHAEHPGAFERAAGGTLFLDEIGELPLELQPRLLRALDNRTVRRVAGPRTGTSTFASWPPPTAISAGWSRRSSSGQTSTSGWRRRW